MSKTKPTTYRVVEIFDSLEGEGMRQGQAATFIRFAGCNLRCAYCDTKYAQDKNAGVDMTIDEILQRVNPNYELITLTGGEPLIQKNLSALLKKLFEKNYWVNIETNGSIDISPLLTEFYDYGIGFTIDYKLPSSGEEDKMFLKNYEECEPVKFVVGSDDDIPALLEIVKKHPSDCSRKHYLLSPSYKQYDPKKLAKLILNEPLLAKKGILQLQLHKTIGIQ